MRLSFPLFVFLGLLGGLPAPVFAILGVGAHAGIDFSADMPDASERIVFAGTRIGSSDGSLVLDSAARYVLTRGDWRRTRYNFGGKFYVDIVPVIDAIELSFNLGVWEYACALIYPVYGAGDSTLTTDTLAASFDNLDLQRRWDVGAVPYAKLHFDITVRKYVLRVPKETRLFNLYAGGGFNAIMKTPAVTEETVTDALAGQISESSYNIYSPVDMGEIGIDGATNAMKQVLGDVGEGLTERQGGMHLMAGAQFQVPVVPLSLYGDAKFMLPFGELDRSTGIEGVGFVCNAGLALSFAGPARSTQSGFE
ncbi:MAG: hypothetical protein GF418_10145 [Chitinivibrionales bacterium]|nr:hypothetical protein [Chitinivibrionales bacterium]MBD3395973.1 hypothetical protein [Chitinivibrionales bacterium]